jgi:hypothetical protein
VRCLCNALLIAVILAESVELIDSAAGGGEKGEGEGRGGKVKRGQLHCAERAERRGHSRLQGGEQVGVQRILELLGGHAGVTGGQWVKR